VTSATTDIGHINGLSVVCSCNHQTIYRINAGQSIGDVKFRPLRPLETQTTSDPEKGNKKSRSIMDEKHQLNTNLKARSGFCLVISFQTCHDF
jgi:hypothetical protein